MTAQAMPFFGIAMGPAGCHHPVMMNASPPFHADPDRVVFDRAELSLILSVYGRFVAAGEWRDYAMSFLRDAAVFSPEKEKSKRCRSMSRPLVRPRGKSMVI